MLEKFERAVYGTLPRSPHDCPTTRRNTRNSGQITPSLACARESQAQNPALIRTSHSATWITRQAGPHHPSEKHTTQNSCPSGSDLGKPNSQTTSKITTGSNQRRYLFFLNQVETKRIERPISCMPYATLDISLLWMYLRIRRDLCGPI